MYGIHHWCENKQSCIRLWSGLDTSTLREKRRKPSGKCGLMVKWDNVQKGFAEQPYGFSPSWSTSYSGELWKDAQSRIKKSQNGLSLNTPSILWEKESENITSTLHELWKYWWQRSFCLYQTNLQRQYKFFSHLFLFQVGILKSKDKSSRNFELAYLTECFPEG